MTCLEHYFENLLFNGEDIKDNLNKNELSLDEQEAVEACYQYILYDIFDGNKDRLKKTLLNANDY